MARKHSLSNGFFRLYLCNYCGDVPDVFEFDDWESVFSHFRFYSHHLGWAFARIIYVSHSGVYREIVRAQYFNGTHCVSCISFPDIFDIIVESFEEHVSEWYQILEDE